MKRETHPDYQAIKVTCSCGNVINTRSTRCADYTIEVCSNCHPFFTGKTKTIDTGGRVARFKQRYATSSEDTASAESK